MCFQCFLFFFLYIYTPIYKYLANILYFLVLESTYHFLWLVIYQAVLEKQSYMLIGRHDIDNLMRRHPASACLPTSLAQANADNHVADAEADAIDLEIGQLLMKLRPIKQVIFSSS